MKGGYLLLNGTFYRETEQLFTVADLAGYPNGIRENFRAENNLVTFAEANFNHLTRGLEAINLAPPDEWSLQRFNRDVSRLLNKNHFFHAAKIEILLFPGSVGTSYLLSVEETTPGFYPVNEKPLLLDFYFEGIKGASNAPSFEPSSRLIRMLATTRAAAINRDNLILSNLQGFACESIGGSFGYFSDGKLYFPAAEAMGYIPPLLPLVEQLAKTLGYPIVLSKQITHNDLLEADELFLIDNCAGLLPVLGLQERRYYKQKTEKLSVALQNYTKQVHTEG